MPQSLIKDSGEIAFVVLEPEEYARLRAAAEDNEDAYVHLAHLSIHGLIRRA